MPLATRSCAWTLCVHRTWILCAKSDGGRRFDNYYGDQAEFLRRTEELEASREEEENEEAETVEGSDSDIVAPIDPVEQ